MNEAVLFSKAPKYCFSTKSIYHCATIFWKNWCVCKFWYNNITNISANNGQSDLQYSTSTYCACTSLMWYAWWKQHMLYRYVSTCRKTYGLAAESNSRLGTVRYRCLQMHRNRYNSSIASIVEMFTGSFCEFMRLSRSLNKVANRRMDFPSWETEILNFQRFPSLGIVLQGTVHKLRHKCRKKERISVT